MSILRLVLLSSTLLLSLLLFLLPIQQPHTAEDLPTHSSHRNPSPPPPRLAYFIAGTNNDGPRIFRLLQALYHPRNYYLLHLDHLASQKQRIRLARMVSSVRVFATVGNVEVVGKGSAVNEDGSSPLALVLEGAAILLRWREDWDWFVNLCASDYPLIPQDDLLHILSFVPRELNFIEHTTRVSSKEFMDVIVDPRLYLLSKGKMFVGSKNRTLPNAFRFFTGSSRVILSRNLVEFAILGWDNFPRTLLLYFTNTRASHRSYFQTLACNSNPFSATVINSNLHFADEKTEPNNPARSWTRSDFEDMVKSGAAFANNFQVDDRVLDRIDSVILRRARGMVSPGGWCLSARRWGSGLCLQTGDDSNLRPSTAARRFEMLLVKLIANMKFRSDKCDR